MGLLATLLHGEQASTPSADADFWYQPIGSANCGGSASGMRVDAESAQKISAFYRGVDLLSTALAMLPLKLYRRLPADAGAETAKGHPLYDVLHRKPNGWQDSFSWRRMKMRHLICHGNAYDLVMAGRRGAVDQLWPIHPAQVTPTQLQSGLVTYAVRDSVTGQSRQYTQDEVFHLRGASDDGVAGKSVLAYARDSIGTALSTESYAAKVFSRGTLNGGVIAVPGLLNEDASKRMARSFVTATGDWHLPKVLEQGAAWTESKMTPEDAQMLLSRKFSIDDIARWLGVPPHMIGSLDRSTNNNIEHQGQEFVTYSLGPWLSLWEFAINDQLIIAPDAYFAEFERDALVRGDLAARWQAHQIAVSTGTYTRNEVRRMENKNKLPGLDTPLDPAHLTGKPSGPALEPDEDDDAARQARAIVVSSAARLLRKEAAALSTAAKRHAADTDGWAVAVTEFYARHAALVADTLQVSAADAGAYCADQARQALDGIAAIAAWTEPDYAARVAAWALGREAV